MKRGIYLCLIYSLSTHSAPPNTSYLYSLWQLETQAKPVLVLYHFILRHKRWEGEDLSVHIAMLPKVK